MSFFRSFFRLSSLTAKLFRFMCTIIRKYSGGSVDSSAQRCDDKRSSNPNGICANVCVCVRCVAHKLSLHGTYTKNETQFYTTQNFMIKYIVVLLYRTQYMELRFVLSIDLVYCRGGNGHWPNTYNYTVLPRVVCVHSMIF